MSKPLNGLGLPAEKKSRSYMMTVWFDKYGQTFEEKVEKMQALFDGGFIRYACLSKEICPESGRLHGHLFTRFIDSWSGVKAFAAYGVESGGGWFEEARKDFPSYEYVSCSGHFAEGQSNGKPKPLNFFEIGQRPESQPLSKKKDFSAAFQMLLDGVSLFEVCKAFPEIAFKSFSNIEKVSIMIKGEQKNDENRSRIEKHLACIPKRPPVKSMTVSGTGKTRSPKKKRFQMAADWQAAMGVVVESFSGISGKES